MKSSRSFIAAAGLSLAALAIAIPATSHAAPPTRSASSSAASGAQDWSGIYGGIHVGFMTSDFSGNGPGVIGPTGTGADVMGGLQAGYNWQQDKLVLGGEADFSLTPTKATGAAGKFEENWTSTLRARAGYAVCDKWLPYATIGLGLTNTDSEAVGGSINNTHVGYAAGAGVDYAVESNLWARIEYLHVDVPEESDTINGAAFKGGSGNNIFRIAANYRFR